jgi:hypothetical protein
MTAVLVVLLVVQVFTLLAFVYAFRGMRAALEDLGRQFAQEAPPAQASEFVAEAPTVPSARDVVAGFSRAVAVARVSAGVLPSSTRR